MTYVFLYAKWLIKTTLSILFSAFGMYVCFIFALSNHLTKFMFPSLPKTGT
jgi:hypothetical protein